MYSSEPEFCFVFSNVHHATTRKFAPILLCTFLLAYCCCDSQSRKANLDARLESRRDTGGLSGQLAPEVGSLAYTKFSRWGRLEVHELRKLELGRFKHAKIKVELVIQ